MHTGGEFRKEPEGWRPRNLDLRGSATDPRQKGMTMPRTTKLHPSSGWNQPPKEGGDKHSPNGVPTQHGVPALHRLDQRNPGAQAQPQDTQSLGHQQSGRRPLARDIADHKKNFIGTDLDEVIKVAPHIHRRPIKSGALHRANLGKRLGQKTRLDFPSEGEILSDALLIALALDGAEFINRRRRKVGISDKWREIMSIE